MPPSLEQRLAALRKAPTSVEVVRTGLRDAHGVVIAAATQDVATQREIAELVTVR